MRNMSLFLNNCPFCGSEPEVWDGAARDHIHIQCSNSECLIKPHVEAFEPRAIKAWNTRK